MSGTAVYALALANGKFYVGKTDRDVHVRFAEHVAGNGCDWTALHDPVEIDFILPNATPGDEDKTLLDYMSKYGIDNVRGGTWSMIELSAADHAVLKRMLATRNDGCLRCGQAGHFADRCPTITPISQQPSSSPTTTKKGKTASIIVCYRCGRSGHYRQGCWASTDVNGRDLSGEESSGDSASDGDEFSSYSYDD